MARTLVVNYGGEVSEFGLKRIQREKLYGKKMKVVVDENEASTSSAYLTRDGTALLPPGSMASLYVNDNFSVASRSELVSVDADGEPRDRVDSTLGVEQPLEGPVNPERVLDHIAKAVYQLDGEGLGDTLKAALEAGDIFETRFAYRAGFDDAPAFLLKNEEGYFALVGTPAEFEFLRKEQAPALDDDDLDDPFDDDDLDFSMF